MGFTLGVAKRAPAEGEVGNTRVKGIPSFCPCQTKGLTHEPTQLVQGVGNGRGFEKTGEKGKPLGKGKTKGVKRGFPTGCKTRRLKWGKEEKVVSTKSS